MQANKKREYNKAYYEKNKEKIKALNKEYYRENQEKQKAYGRAHYDQHKDRHKAKNKRWKTENRERVREHCKQYYQKHRAQIREKQKERYKARQVGKQLKSNDTTRFSPTVFLLKHKNTDYYKILYRRSGYKRILYDLKDVYDYIIIGHRECTTTEEAKYFRNKMASYTPWEDPNLGPTPKEGYLTQLDADCLKDILNEDRIPESSNTIYTETDTASHEVWML